MQCSLLLLATISHHAYADPAQRVFPQDFVSPQWATASRDVTMNAWERPSATVANIPSSFQDTRGLSGQAGADSVVANSGAAQWQFPNRGVANDMANAASASQWQFPNRGSYSPSSPYSSVDGSFPMSLGGLAMAPPVSGKSYSGQFGWAPPSAGFLQGSAPTSDQGALPSQPWVHSAPDLYATGVESHSFQGDGAHSASFVQQGSAVQGPGVLPSMVAPSAAQLPMQQPWTQPASWWLPRQPSADAAAATATGPQPPVVAAAEAPSLVQKGVAPPSLSLTDAVPYATLLRWLEVAGIAGALIVLLQNFRFTCERRNSGPPVDAGRNYNSTNASDCCGGQRSGNSGGHRSPWHTGGRVESWEKLPRRPLPAGGVDEPRLASLARIPRVVRDEDEEMGVTDAAGTN